MSINRWICVIVGLWRSLRHFAHVSGCDYVEQENDVPALVSTSRCEICGTWAVDWKRVERP